MATDDSEPRDEGSRRGPQNFVDRDDDEGTADVDFDYDDDFPPGTTEEDDEGPDPGYAAFAAELEDPLADWPAPDARLEDLPEIQRHAEDPAASAAGGDGYPVPPPELSTGPADTAEEPDAEDFPEAAFFDDPTDESTDTGTEGNADENEGPLFRDRDEDDLEPIFASPEDEDRDAVGGTWLDPEPDRADRDEGMAHDSDEDEDVEEDEDFVDDFLADLDDEEPGPEPAPAQAEASPWRVPDLPVPSRSSPATDADIAVAAATSATVERSQPVENSADRQPAERGLSPGMIIVVLAALGLLAAGGYGVVQQRSSLEGEIRELQAQLATAMSPEEAAAEREQTRQVELANESLEARLEVLQVENAALEAQVSELEEQLAGRQAGSESADEGAATLASSRAPTPVAMEEAAAGSTEPQQAPETGSSSTGPWFVNFGSFGERSVADRWARQLSVDDGQVVVREVSAGGKTLYRVRVVALGSRYSAETVAKELEKEFELPRLWVGKN